MKNLILAILVAGLVLSGAALAEVQVNSGFKQVAPVDTLSICGVSLAHAVAGSEDGVFTTTQNVVMGITPIGKDGITPTGPTAGFVVNSKLDPVVGEFQGYSQSTAADTIAPNTAGTGFTFTGIEGMASAANDVKIDVGGSKLASVDMNSFTNTNVKVDIDNRNTASSASILHLDAKAIGA